MAWPSVVVDRATYQNTQLICLALLVCSFLSCTSSSGGSSGSVQPNASTADVVLITMPDGTTVPARPNQLVLAFTDTATVQQQQAVQDFIKSHNGVVLDQILEIPMLTIQVNPGELFSMMNALNVLPGVWQVMPNIVVSPALDPTPAGWLWDSWLEVIRARQAWDITVGSPDVPIVILDSDLRAEIPQDQSKFISRLSGGGLGDFGTFIGHGTWVAAIAGALGNDSSGVAGLAWDSPLYGGAVLRDANGNSDAGTLNRAIVQAGESVGSVFPNRTIIINLSWGLDDKILPNITNEAVQKIWYLILPSIKAVVATHDVLFVLSSGNSRQLQHLDDPFPADATTFHRTIWQNHVLVVGGVDPNKNPIYIQGGAVPISAPAQNISLPLATSIIAGDGTSLAAPQVAGIGALIKSVNPVMTASEVKNRLLSSACLAGGTRIVNAWLAVDPTVSDTTACNPPPPPIRPQCVFAVNPQLIVYINCARVRLAASGQEGEHDTGLFGGRAEEEASGMFSSASGVAIAAQNGTNLPFSPITVSVRSSLGDVDRTRAVGSTSDGQPVYERLGGASDGDVEVTNQWISIYDPDKGVFTPGRGTLRASVRLTWSDFSWHDGPPDISFDGLRTVSLGGNDAKAFVRIEVPAGGCTYTIYGVNQVDYVNRTAVSKFLNIISPDPNNCLVAKSQFINVGDTTNTYDLNIPLSFLYSQPLQMSFTAHAESSGEGSATATFTILGLDIDGGLGGNGDIIVGDQAAVGIGQ